MPDDNIVNLGQRLSYTLTKERTCSQEKINGKTRKLLSVDDYLYLKFHYFIRWEGLEPVKPIAYLAKASVRLATSVDH